MIKLVMNQIHDGLDFANSVQIYYVDFIGAYVSNYPFKKIEDNIIM